MKSICRLCVGVFLLLLLLSGLVPDAVVDADSIAVTQGKTLAEAPIPPPLPPAPPPPKPPQVLAS